MHLEPLTSAGQIKKGDTLLIEDKEGNVQAATAKHVLNPGSDIEGMREEVVFNTRQNLYFITSMYLAGKSWVKQVNIVRAGAPTGPMAEILELKAANSTRWRDRDDSYWLARLMQEVGELASSLVGDHEDPPEHELRQVASIASNWLEKRAAETKEKETASHLHEIAVQSF